MPEISVIIPAYNAERTIAETVQSVLNQTFVDFELIIVNDGSTDGTATAIEQFCDARIRFLSFENAGVSVARNRGIASATGRFIAFLDADDLWTPEKLASQHASLETNPEAGVAYSWNTFIDERGNSLGRQNPVYFEGNVYSELLVCDFLVCGSTILVRREAIADAGEFDPELINYQTIDYWRRLARQWSFVLVPEYQIVRRVVSGSHSSNLERHEKFMMLAIDKSFRDAPDELQHLKNKSKGFHYQHLAHKFLERKQDRNGIHLAGQKLWAAIEHYPPLLLNRNMQRTLRNWMLLTLFRPKTFRLMSQIYHRAKLAKVSRSTHDTKSEKSIDDVAKLSENF